MPPVRAPRAPQCRLNASARWLDARLFGRHGLRARPAAHRGDDRAQDEHAQRAGERQHQQRAEGSAHGRTGEQCEQGEQRRDVRLRFMMLGRCKLVLN